MCALNRHSSRPLALSDLPGRAGAHAVIAVAACGAAEVRSTGVRPWSALGSTGGSTARQALHAVR